MSVQLLSRVRFLAKAWTAAHQAPLVMGFSKQEYWSGVPLPSLQASLSITNSWSLLKIMSIESVMPSNHLIFCLPFSCLQFLPASGSFQVSQLLTSGSQSIGVSASASVLPMNTQDRSPLGWTGWISLKSKGLKSLLQRHSSKASILHFSAFSL